MRTSDRRLTRHDIEWKTSIHRQLLDRMIKDARRANDDTERPSRLLDLCCRYCYYLAGGLAGQGFTSTRCGLCDKEMMFSNTNVDRLCPECAKKNSLCKHCGADLELRASRRKFPGVELKLEIKNG